MTAVLPLSDIDGACEAAVGPKMARLATLRSAGLRIPEGFVITGGEFRSHLDRTGLRDVAHGLLAAVDAGLDAGVAAGRLARAWDRAPIHPDLARRIAEAYDRLGQDGAVAAPLVAVRSSATHEDARDASFAGVFTSHLGVRGGDAVADAVQRCWRSFHGTTAIAYARRAGVALGDGAMAVGVMELVDAHCAGVAFSVHPVTGNREVVVIEASWGWGESVVQGSVTPDFVEVSKTDLAPISWQVNHKSRLSTFESGRGVVEVPMPNELRGASALTPGQVAAVARDVVRIEQLMGLPVDVEWVVPRGWRDGDAVYIVQARPVSASG